MPEDAFYFRVGDGFEATELARGPWDPRFQHAGPPAALLGRAIERLPAEVAMQVGRITFEILRPIPIAQLRVSAEVVRPGRSVEMVDAGIWAGSERLVRATGWRLRTKPVEFATPAGVPAPLPGLERAEAKEFFATGSDVGYHSAMEYRFVSGSFLEAGPAAVWMRMRHPLVAGEEPTPLQRVLAAADTGNGASAALDWQRYTFINVDLSVHLHRMPVGEWIGLEAVTIPEANGVGIADTRLHDLNGPIGRGVQTLLVDARADTERATG